jgi:two-component system, NarL family, invasion response regulator UvrY
MSVISILMVDDHPVVREGYSRLLERRGGFRVCAQADNAAQAYQRYKEHQPDVVIMDLLLPGVGGTGGRAADP